jgi:hypothetical protein
MDSIDLGLLTNQIFRRFAGQIQAAAVLPKMISNTEPNRA